MGKPHSLSRVTYSNRLLYAAVPSSMYAKNDKTLDTLVAALVSDFNKLYQDGFMVQSLIVWSKEFLKLDGPKVFQII